MQVRFLTFTSIPEVSIQKLVDILKDFYQIDVAISENLLTLSKQGSNLYLYLSDGFAFLDFQDPSSYDFSDGYEEDETFDDFTYDNESFATKVSALLNREILKVILMNDFCSSSSFEEDESN